MTPRSRISFGRPSLPDDRLNSGWTRTLIPSLLIAACGGIIAGSSALPSHADAVSATDTASGPRLLDAAPARTQKHLPAQRPHESTDDVLMQTLAGIVAKRYRVASDATREFVEITYHEAKRNRLDPLLIIAVIAVESRFNPIAESDGGALGLMQVVPRFHVRNVDDTTRAAMLDPRQNIGLGARVLRQYVKAAGTEIAGLQLYNGSSDDATNAYANKVMAEKQRLEDSLRRARERA